MTTDAMRSRRAFLLGASAVFVGACSTDAESDAATTISTEQTASSTAEGAAAATSDSQAAGDETDNSTDGGDGTDGIEPLTSEMFEVLPMCVLTAPSAAGPFPSASPLDRSEIHEGYPGHPLRVGIRVVDKQCQPIPAATVDIWHTDASGDYSEYEDGGNGKDEGPGSTFCRGAQSTGANGIVEFLTIYPGWYPGRTVHIHASVRVDGDTFTSQLYLDEELTQQVHATGEYSQFGSQDTSWAADSLAGRPDDDGSLFVTTAATTSLGAGTLALINVSLDRG